MARKRPRPTGAAPATEIEPQRLREFSRRLRAWFRRHGRDLPWRRTRDPYRVLVSELMLQQTQVSRVIDYYERFLERFPTLQHVAEAPPRHVLASWEGLGYYARARNLHALARRVTRDGGPLPSDPTALRELPGIGAYTAGAVASFAYERRSPLVDTNVARVLHRAFAPHLDPKSARAQRLGWDIAERLLPRTGRASWVHNQALMELGALVCTARARHCGRCPVARLCATRVAETNRGVGAAARRGAPPAPPLASRR
ncbi:MAG TPA: A/G-specific adenine glycosylase [Gemmatimonadaceae bacterium]|nr:A/G-specific adenine glycosylase [Gemmatimonadaceae bacterium]